MPSLEHRAARADLVDYFSPTIPASQTRAAAALETVEQAHQ